MKILTATATWLAALFVALPASAEPLACERKLSVLSADVAQTGQQLEALAKAVATAAKRFGDDEVVAQTAQTCPEDITARLDQHRTAIAGLSTGELMRLAADDLVCAQFFSTRIQIDLDKAQSEGNARMVERLLAISKTIVAIDAVATRQATEAAFLQSKQARLLEGVEAVQSLCSALESIYE